MSILCFTLTMPGVSSWNGRWSGDGKLFAKVKTFRGKSAEKRVNEILEKSPYYHSWADGWSAKISVSKITAKEAAQIRKKTRGFYGYDWMIDNIIHYLSTDNREVKNLIIGRRR